MNSEAKSISSASANTAEWKTSEVLYAAAAYMRKHGFSAHLNTVGYPRCFIGSVSAGLILGNYLDAAAADAALAHVRNVIFADAQNPFSDFSLARDGWNTEDATAALEIAADYAAAEGQ